MQTSRRRLIRLILKYTRDPGDRARALRLRRELRAAEQRWLRQIARRVDQDSRPPPHPVADAGAGLTQ